jgi:hypothetical protein
MKATIADRYSIALMGIFETMEYGDSIITYACQKHKIRAKNSLFRLF